MLLSTAAMPDPITLGFIFFDAHGRNLGNEVRLTLAPGEWHQIDQPLAALGTPAGYVRIEKIAGGSRFVAYACSTTR
ncbi:MAG: hypothetical protein ABI584_06020 [Acidobacteriota bacterium]